MSLTSPIMVHHHASAEKVVVASATTEVPPPPPAHEISTTVRAVARVIQEADARQFPRLRDPLTGELNQDAVIEMARSLGCPVDDMQGRSALAAALSACAARLHGLAPRGGGDGSAEGGGTSMGQHQGGGGLDGGNSGIGRVISLCVAADSELRYSRCSGGRALPEGVTRAHAAAMAFASLPAGVADDSALALLCAAMARQLEAVNKSLRVLCRLPLQAAVAASVGATLTPLTAQQAATAAAEEARMSAADDALWIHTRHAERLVAALRQNHAASTANGLGVVAPFDAWDLLPCRDARTRWAAAVGRNAPATSMAAAVSAGLFAGMPEWSLPFMRLIIDPLSSGVCSVFGFSHALDVWGVLPVMPLILARDLRTRAFLLSAGPIEAAQHVLSEAAAHGGSGTWALSVSRVPGELTLHVARPAAAISQQQHQGPSPSTRRPSSIGGGVDATASLTGNNNDGTSTLASYTVRSFPVRRVNGAWHFVGLATADSGENFEFISDACAAYDRVLRVPAGVAYDLNALPFVGDVDPTCSALHRAAYFGNAALVRRIFECGGAAVVNLAQSDPLLVGQVEWPPLHFATASPHPSISDVVSLLLAHGARPDYCDAASGQTALYNAVRNGHAGACRLLLRRVPLLTASPSVPSPLMLALGPHWLHPLPHDVARLHDQEVDADVVEAILQHGGRHDALDVECALHIAQSKYDPDRYPGPLGGPDPRYVERHAAWWAEQEGGLLLDEERHAATRECIVAHGAWLRSHPRRMAQLRDSIRALQYFRFYLSVQRLLADVRATGRTAGLKS